VDPADGMARGSGGTPAHRTLSYHLLADARQVATTRALMDSYLKYLHECGEKRVYGQMVVFEDRRSTKMFERYGFKVLNKSEITKYRIFIPSPSISAPSSRISTKTRSFTPR